MKFVNRSDFPDQLPEKGTLYCWFCHAAGLDQRGKPRKIYTCGACGLQSRRVLLYDPRMQLHFNHDGDLVHERYGVLVLQSDGKLLLVRRAGFSLLSLPGGHLAVDEQPRSAAAQLVEQLVGSRPAAVHEVFDGDIAGDSCVEGADIHHWRVYLYSVNDPETVALGATDDSWGWYGPLELTKQTAAMAVLELLSLL